MESWFASYEVLTRDGQRGKGHGFFQRNPDESIENLAKRILTQVAKDRGCDPDRAVMISFNRL